MSRLHEQINEADIVSAFEQGDAYRILVEPIKAELEGLKYAYDCDTLEEMATLKGKRDGLAFILKFIETIKADGQAAREALRKEQERALRNTPPADSTEL
jgi:hypothetical protein